MCLTVETFGGKNATIPNVVNPRYIIYINKIQKGCWVNMFYAKPIGKG